MTDLEIGPHTRLGPLLDAHPGLEDTLAAAAPAFAKLKNPVLRATVAKVATLEQVARVGGLPVPALVGLVRSALGLGPAPETGSGAGPASQAWPPWFREEDVRVVVDAAEILASGAHPLAAVRRALEGLPPGAVVELRSDFEPAPLLERMRSEGIEVACVRDGDRFRTVLRR